MKVFILEDDIERLRWFRDSLKGHEIEYTDNWIMADKLLKENKYDRIFLDHDLGLAEGDTDINNGLTVARNIAGTINNDTPVVIHTQNPVGARNMHAAIYYDAGNTDVTIAPFGTFTI